MSKPIHISRPVDFDCDDSEVLEFSPIGSSHKAANEQALPGSLYDIQAKSLLFWTRVKTDEWKSVATRNQIFNAIWSANQKKPKAEQLPNRTCIEIAKDENGDIAYSYRLNGNNRETHKLAKEELDAANSEYISLQKEGEPTVKLACKVQNLTLGKFKQVAISSAVIEILGALVDLIATPFTYLYQWCSGGQARNFVSMLNPVDKHDRVGAIDHGTVLSQIHFMGSLFTQEDPHHHAKGAELLPESNTTTPQGFNKVISTAENYDLPCQETANGYKILFHSQELSDTGVHKRSVWVFDEKEKKEVLSGRSDLKKTEWEDPKKCCLELNPTQKPKDQKILERIKTQELTNLERTLKSQLRLYVLSALGKTESARREAVKKAGDFKEFQAKLGDLEAYRHLIEGKRKTAEGQLDDTAKTSEEDAQYLLYVREKGEECYQDLIKDLKFENFEGLEALYQFFATDDDDYNMCNALFSPFNYVNKFAGKFCKYYKNYRTDFDELRACVHVRESKYVATTEKWDSKSKKWVEDVPAHTNTVIHFKSSMVVELPKKHWFLEGNGPSKPWKEVPAKDQITVSERLPIALSATQKMAKIFNEAHAFGKEMWEARNSGSMRRSDPFIDSLQKRLFNLSEQNPYFLLPLAQGEGRDYLSHYLIFKYEMDEQKQPRIIMKDICFSSPTLEAGRTQMMKSYNVTKTILDESKDDNKRISFARALFHLQPVQRIKDEHEKTIAGPMQADLTLDRVMCGFGEPMASEALEKKVSRDPVKALFNVITQIEVQDHETLSFTNTHLKDITSSKARFFGVYVNHLMGYYEKNEALLSNDERVKALKGIQWYASKVRHYMQNELGAEMANAVTNHLILFLDKKLEEAGVVEKIEQEAKQKLQSRVNLFEASLKESVDNALHIDRNATSIKVDGSRVGMQMWGFVDKLRAPLTQEEEKKLREKCFKEQLNFAEKKIEWIKEARRLACESIIAECEQLLIDKDPIACKTLALTALEGLPVPHTQGEQFWDTLTIEEMRDWIKKLGLLSEKLFEANLRSGAMSLKPHESFEFNVTVPLIQRYLLERILPVKCREADKLIQSYVPHDDTNFDPEVAQRLSAVEAEKGKFINLREGEIRKKVEKEVKDKRKQTDREDKEKIRDWEAQNRAYDAQLKKFEKYQSTNNPKFECQYPGERPKKPDIDSKEKKDADDIETTKKKFHEEKQACQFLKELNAIKVATLHQDWDQITEGCSRTQAAMGRFAKLLCIPLELYAYKLGGNNWTGCCYPGIRDEKEQKDLWLMQQDCSLLLGATPEQEKRYAACKEMLVALNKTRVFDAQQASKFSINFLIGYEGLGDGTQLEGVQNTRKLNDLQSKTFAYQKGFFDYGQGASHLSIEELGFIRRVDEMRKIMRNPTRHLELLFNVTLQAAINQFKEFSEKSIKANCRSMERIHLTAQIRGFGGEHGGCFNLTDNRLDQGMYGTTNATEEVSTGNPYWLELTEDQARDQTKGDEERELADSVFGQNKRRHFFDDSDKRLYPELSDAQEFMLRACSQGKTTEGKDGNYSYLTITLCMKYMTTYPETLAYASVRNTLYKNLFQQGLIRNALKKNPDLFTNKEGCFGEKLNAVCTKLQKEASKLQNQENAQELGGGRLCELFIREFSERVRRQAMDLVGKIGREKALEIAEGMPTYQEQQMVYQAGYESAYQKIFAAYALRYYWYQLTDNPKPSKEQWIGMLRAFFILQQSLSEHSHMGKEAELVHQVQRDLLPRLYFNMLHDSAAHKASEFRDAILNDLATNKKSESTQAEESGEWTASEKPYIFTKQKGDVVVALDLRTGEGYPLPSPANNRCKLPERILQDSNYQFLFGEMNEVVTATSAPNSTISEFIWKNEKDGTTYEFLLDRTPPKKVQIFQKTPNGERFRFQQLKFADDSAMNKVWQLIARTHNKKIEDLITKKGVWISVNPKGKQDTFKVLVAQHGQNLEKDPITLKISNRKIQEAYIGSGKERKWLCAGLSNREAKLFSCVANKDILLLSTDKMHADEIRITTDPHKQEQLVLKRSGEEWQVEGRGENWILQFSDTQNCVKQFGPQWQEYVLPLRNKKTGEQEFLIFPFLGIGSGKTGGDVTYLKSLSDIFSLHKKQLGGLLPPDLEPALDILRNLIGMAETAFGGPENVLAWIKRGALKIPGVDLPQFDPEDPKFKMAISYLETLFTPRGIYYKQSGGLKTASPAGCFYLAHNAALRRDWGKASEYLQLANQQGKSDPSETKQLKETLEIIFINDLAPDLMAIAASIMELLKKQQEGQQNFTIEIQALMKKMRAMLVAKSPSEVGYRAKLLATLMSLNARLMSQSGETLFNQKVDDELKKLIPEDLMKNGLVQDLFGQLADTSTGGSGIIVKLLGGLYYSCYIEQLGKRHRQYVDNGLLLTPEEEKSLTSIPALTLLMPVVKSVVGEGSLKNPVSLKPIEFEVPDLDDMEKLSESLAKYVKSDGIWSLHELHQKQGTYPKWENILANFWVYWEWIFEENTKKTKLHVEDLAFLWRDLPVLAEKASAEEKQKWQAVDIARRTLLLHWHYCRDPRFDFNRQKDHRLEEFKKNLRDAKLARTNMPDLAGMESKIDELEQAASRNPTLTNILYSKVYASYVALREVFSHGKQMEYHSGIAYEVSSQKKFIGACNSCFKHLWEGVKDTVEGQEIIMIHPTSLGKPLDPVVLPPVKPSEDPQEKLKNDFYLQACQKLVEEFKSSTVSQLVGNFLKLPEGENVVQVLEGFIDNTLEGRGVKDIGGKKPSVYFKSVLFSLLDLPHLVDHMGEVGKLVLSLTADQMQGNMVGELLESEEVKNIQASLKKMLLDLHTSYRKAAGYPDVSLFNVRKVKAASYEPVQILPYKLSCLNAEKVSWKEFFTKQDFKIWDERSNFALNGDENNTAPFSKDIKDEREKAKIKKIRRGIKQAAKDLKERTRFACKLDALVALHKKTSGRLKMLCDESKSLKKELLHFVKSYAYELGMMHLFSNAHATPEDEIVQLVLDLYRNGELGKMDPTSNQAYAGVQQHFAELITSYLLASTEMQQHIFAIDVCENLRAVAQDIFKWIPKNLDKKEREALAQRLSLNACTDEDLKLLEKALFNDCLKEVVAEEKLSSAKLTAEERKQLAESLAKSQAKSLVEGWHQDWLLYSANLHLHLVVGSDRNRYAEEKEGEFYLKDQKFARAYLVSDMRDKWLSRPKAIDGLENLLKDMKEGPSGDPVRFIKVKMGTGKTAFIFPTAIDRLFRHQITRKNKLTGEQEKQDVSAVMMVTSDNLIPQLAAALGHKAYEFKFNLDFGLDYVYAHELKALSGKEREKYFKEKILTDERIENHLATQLKALLQLKAERRAVLTSPAHRGYLRNKRVELQAQLKDTAVEAKHRASLLRQIQLLKGIENFFADPNAVYLLDEDTNFDISFEYNFATGKHRTINENRFEMLEFMMRTIHSNFPDLWNKFVTNNVRTMTLNDLEPVIKIMCADEAAWKQLKWSAEDWKKIDQVQLLDYIMGRRPEVPDGLPKWEEGNFKDINEQPNKSYIAALKTLVSKTFDSVRGTNPTLARGVSESNGVMVVPYEEGKEKEGVIYGEESESLFHHGCYYIGMGCQLKETVFFEKFTELGATDRPMSEHYPEDTWSKWRQAIENVKLSTKDEEGKEKYKTNYEAFINSEKLGFERFLLLRHLMLVDDKIRFFDEQIAFNSQDLGLGVDVRVGSGTGQEFALNLSDYMNQNKSSDEILGETILCLDLKEEVDIFGKDGKETARDYILKMAGHEKCHAVINIDYETEGDDSERLARKISKQHERQVVYRTHEEEDLVKKILNPGTNNFPIPFEPSAIHHKQDPFYYFAPFDCRGIDYKGMKRGGGRFAAVLFGTGNEEDKFAQAVWRQRHIDLGHATRPACDVKTEVQVKKVCEARGLIKKGQNINAGHALRYFTTNTLIEEDVKNIKAQIFKAQKPLKTHLDTAVRKLYNLKGIGDTSAIESFEADAIGTLSSLYIMNNKIKWKNEYQPNVLIDNLEYIKKLYDDPNGMGQLQVIQQLEEEFCKVATRLAEDAMDYLAERVKWAVNGKETFKAAWEALDQLELEILKEDRGSTEEEHITYELRVKCASILIGFAKARLEIKEELKLFESEAYKNHLKENLPKKIAGDTESGSRTEQKTQQRSQQQLKQQQKAERKVIVPTEVSGKTEALDFEAFRNIESKVEVFEKLASKFSKGKFLNEERVLKSCFKKYKMMPMSIVARVNGFEIPESDYQQIYVSHRAWNLLKKTNRAEIPHVEVMVLQGNDRLYSVIITPCEREQKWKKEKGKISIAEALMAERNPITTKHTKVGVYALSTEEDVSPLFVDFGIKKPHCRKNDISLLHLLVMNKLFVNWSKFNFEEMDYLIWYVENKEESKILERMHQDELFEEVDMMTGDKKKDFGASTIKTLFKSIREKNEKWFKNYTTRKFEKDYLYFGKVELAVLMGWIKDPTKDSELAAYIQRLKNLNAKKSVQFLEIINEAKKSSTKAVIKTIQSLKNLGIENPDRFLETLKQKLAHAPEVNVESLVRENERRDEKGKEEMN